MQIVREFFELNMFHVLTHWQHEALTGHSDAGALLFIERAVPRPPREVEFLLRAEDLPGIARAVVEVRAWHGERFYASVIESSPVLAHVAGSETHALAQSVFGSPDFATILVLSELPASPEPRQRALQALQELGIGHTLEFSAILQETLSRISAHGNYAPSQTLQTMRLLKRYGLMQRQQLEFPFPVQSPALSEIPDVYTDVIPEDPEDGE